MGEIPSAADGDSDCCGAGRVGLALAAFGVLSIKLPLNRLIRAVAAAK